MYEDTNGYKGHTHNSAQEYQLDREGKGCSIHTAILQLLAILEQELQLTRTHPYIFHEVCDYSET